MRQKGYLGQSRTSQSSVQCPKRSSIVSGQVPKRLCKGGLCCPPRMRSPFIRLIWKPFLRNFVIEKVKLTLCLVESSLRCRRRRGRRSVFAVRLLDLCPHLLESFTVIHHLHHVTRDANTDASSQAHTIKYQFIGS